MTGQPKILPHRVGVFNEMPSEEYHRMEGASAHRLNTLFDGVPLDVYQEITTPSAPSPGMIFGTAVHLAVLQPDIFPDMVFTADQCQATTGKGERCKSTGKYRSNDGAWFCGVKSHNAGNHPEPAGIFLSAEDHARCLLVADAIMKHPYASALIADGKGWTETAVGWIDEASGCPCKMLADCPALSLKAMADLKTVTDITDEFFRRQLKSLGYGRQAAMNRMGAEAARWEVNTFAFIAALSVPPFHIRVFELKQEEGLVVFDGQKTIAIDTEYDYFVGREEIAQMLPVFKRCMDSGEWPGYPAKIERIGMGKWDLKEAMAKYGDLDRAF